MSAFGVKFILLWFADALFHFGQFLGEKSVPARRAKPVARSFPGISL